jgi:D-sedoheptulose 7-phosphate isomerase
MNWLETYFRDQAAVLGQTSLEPLQAVLAVLEEARAAHRHIFVFGNGGSASTASHFAADLGKNTIRPSLPRFRVTCLNDNMALLSAYGNDLGYDAVFVEPLLSLAEPGDVAIAISASGNSPNVVRAVQAANERGLVTIGLTGMGGGKLKSLASHCLVVPSGSYEHVEDTHMALCHALVSTFKQKYQEPPQGG